MNVLPIIACIVGPVLVLGAWWLIAAAVQYASDCEADEEARDQLPDPYSPSDPDGWYDTGPDLPAEMTACLGDTCAGLPHGPGALVRPPFHSERSKL